MSIDYTWEKFSVAVESMAVAHGSLQERLCNAYVSSIIRLCPEDFEEDYRADFLELKRTLTHRPARFADEGTVKATTDQMTDEEASDAARLLLKLYDHVSALYHESLYSHSLTAR